MVLGFFFFFKQKTAYEIYQCDWSSDVCSSDLGILPLMPLFCNQSNPSVIRRYRSVWIVKQGIESYEMVETISGYNFFDFMDRNKADFRRPVLSLLKGLSK